MDEAAVQASENFHSLERMEMQQESLWNEAVAFTRAKSPASFEQWFSGVQFDGMTGVLWVWLAIGIGQALEGAVVTPHIVGERIGLHPVAVIFALLAFGQVFGFFGVLLALPASAAPLVALRQLRAAYVASPLYGQ